MRYAVRALGNGGVVTVAVNAADAEAARHQVAARDLRPLSVATASLAWPQRSTFPLTLFSQELLALLEAGLTITEGIEALCDKESRGEAREVFDRLLAALREGKRFSLALEQQPEHFPILYIGLMRAAERTSNLPESLGRYLEYRGRLDGVRSRVVSALIYPAILGVVGLVVTAFLLGYVVPRFAGVYQGTGRELPWLSQQLMAWGNFAAHHTQGLILGAIGLILATLAGLRTWWSKDGPQRLLRRLPGIASTVATFELSRLYLSLGTLLVGLTAMVGFWATLSLNIPDFTRYGKSQREQMLGQTLFAIVYSFVFTVIIGVVVASFFDLSFNDADFVSATVILLVGSLSFVGIGVVPDVEIHPTQESLAAGRDAVLERGLQVAAFCLETERSFTCRVLV